MLPNLVYSRYISLSGEQQEWAECNLYKENVLTESRFIGHLADNKAPYGTFTTSFTSELSKIEDIDDLPRHQ